MISVSSAGILTPVLYSNESEISQDLGSNESQTVIKQKTFLQAVQKNSNLQSNKKLSPLSFNQREDNNFLFSFLFTVLICQQHSPSDVLETMTINSFQFLWFHSYVINVIVNKNIEQKLEMIMTILFSQQNIAQTNVQSATEITIMTDTGITCGLDVNTEI